MSACVQVPPVESIDGTDIPVHEQLVDDLTCTVVTDSINLNAIRRKYSYIPTTNLGNVYYTFFYSNVLLNTIIFIVNNSIYAYNLTDLCVL